MSVMFVTEGRIEKVFGVELGLSNGEMNKLDSMAAKGSEGELKALNRLVRKAEKISASPPNGNGHNGHGHRSKKPSKAPATMRVSRVVVACMCR